MERYSSRSESSSEEDCHEGSSSHDSPLQKERRDSFENYYGVSNPKMQYQGFVTGTHSVDTDEESQRKRSLQDDSFGSSYKKMRYERFSSHSRTESTDSEAGSSSRLHLSSDDEQEVAGFGATAGMTQRKESAPVYAKTAWKMMENMGYKEGKGLGVREQGRVNIVEASKQRGRRGLGLKMRGLEPADIVWDESLEVIEVKKDVIWFADCEQVPLEEKEMVGWRVIGKKKRTINDEFTFCSENFVRGVIQAKSVFDELESEEMRKARTRSNPFETIRGGIFLNRAAMKMANMDADLDFMFTDPKTQSGKSSLIDNEPLYFADVCSGPGGFSEYVLWRKKWEAKGFGFTLIGDCDFKLHDFYAAPRECLEPYYGEDKTGNVFVPENQLALRRHIMDNTDERGVHFMMADGGFSVEGQENIQEILSKQLYLCQCLVALMVVRTGGHFVCKLFDLFTPFSAGLVYLMYRCFDKITLHKPNTSRPANSERYIICKWKKENTDDIQSYMFETNRILGECMKTISTKDVNELVPLEVMREDEAFFNSLVESNENIAVQQIIGLRKIQAFCRDTSLEEHRQKEFHKKSLELWGVPEEARKAPQKVSAEETLNNVLTIHGIFRISELMASKEIVLDHYNYGETLRSVFDFRYVVLGSDREQRNNEVERGIIIGLGGKSVYLKRISQKQSSCRKLELSAELPRGTVVYGEIVQELRGESKGQKKISAIHIIDALMLGGVDVSKHHLSKRIQMCEKFAKSISKADLAPVRVKTLHKLQLIKNDFQPRLQMKIFKKGGRRVVYSVQSNDDRYFVPSGLLFLKITKPPWTVNFSKRANRMYYYNYIIKDSTFDLPKDGEILQNFFDTMRTAVPWWWGPGVTDTEQRALEDGELELETLLEHVAKQTR